MISSLRGTVLSTLGAVVVIEVGGVGFSVEVTPGHASALRVGEQALVHTALIVRDDDLSLFGFADPDELQVFGLLRGVTGVGPKSALGVLAAMTTTQIAHAIESDDDAAFRKVSGIGPKTAKLIVVSLAGKMGGFAAAPTRSRATPTADDEVLRALVALGWSERVAAGALAEVVERASDVERAQTSLLLRLALAQLGPQHDAAVGRGA